MWWIKPLQVPAYGATSSNSGKLLSKHVKKQKNKKHEVKIEHQICIVICGWLRGKLEGMVTASIKGTILN